MIKILSSKEELSKLKGNLTEIVKVTFDLCNINRLNGKYLFEREGNKNNFFRKNPNSEEIEVLSCETPYLNVDKKIGVSFNIIHYIQKKINSGNKIYEELKNKLNSFGLWL